MAKDTVIATADGWTLSPWADRCLPWRLPLTVHRPTWSRRWSVSDSTGFTLAVADGEAAAEEALAVLTLEAALL